MAGIPPASSSIKAIESVEQLEALKRACGAATPLVVSFWADWCEPCRQVNAVVAELAARHSPRVRFASVEAEEVGDVTEPLGVSAVPCVVVLRNGVVDARIEGADVPALVAKVDAVAASAAPAATTTKKAAAATKPSADGGGGSAAADDAALQARLRALVARDPVMLFMKGTPDEPCCGFSRRIVELLRNAGVSNFGSFDILSDNDVRQGLKTFSDFPTFPQLYARGKLVGGLDIATELAENDELLDELGVRGGNGATTLDDRLRALTTRDKVVLFMKGEPDAPKCGFSNKMIELLRAHSIVFSTFDILTDNDVRQGLKKFSNFPTFPQLYANGKLVGGLDIATELAENDELTADELASY